MTTPYPQPPRTGLKIALVGGVLAVLCCLGGTIAAVAGVGTTTTGKAPHARVKAGRTARDGRFEFTVIEVTYEPSVGDQYLSKKAQGQFALVKVAIKNVGTDARMLDGASQRAFGPTGVTYEHDTVAESYANKGTETFLNIVNPGHSITGLIVFDIPAGTKLTAIELHDSTFSGGTVIDLT